MMQCGWVLIPPHVYQSDLNDRQKMLMGRILTLSDKHGCCFASDAFLAAEFGVTERHIRRSINVLSKAGFIKKRTRHKGRGKGSSRSIYPIWPGQDEPSLGPDIIERTSVSGPTIERTKMSGELASVAAAAIAKEEKPAKEEKDSPPVADPKETTRILRWWIDQQSVDPTRTDISRQGAVAKRIATHQTPEQIRFALIGLPLIPPCSLGTPPDCFLLERHFSTAVEAGARKNGHRKESKDGWYRHGTYVNAQELYR